tara:strand:+ start:918 stop:1019 length:102 start_codon:yes stop_codon:yes gene_type:complete
VGVNAESRRVKQENVRPRKVSEDVEVLGKADTK